MFYLRVLFFKITIQALWEGRRYERHAASNDAIMDRAALRRGAATSRDNLTSVTSGVAFIEFQRFEFPFGESVPTFLRPMFLGEFVGAQGRGKAG